MNRTGQPLSDGSESYMLPGTDECSLCIKTTGTEVGVEPYGISA